MAVEFSQELVSVGVIVIVCVTLSISCLILWLLRCRKDQIRHREGKDDRQRELDNFEDNMKKSKPPPPSNSKQKVHEAKKDAPKKQDTDVEKGKKDDKKKRAAGTVARTDETMQQFEARVKALDTIEEDGTPIRNKRLDTVSVIATGSSETLQRNDSKVNVFPVERIEEIDLNPGLNGPINLDTI